MKRAEADPLAVKRRQLAEVMRNAGYRMDQDALNRLPEAHLDYLIAEYGETGQRVW